MCVRGDALERTRGRSLFCVPHSPRTQPAELPSHAPEQAAALVEAVRVVVNPAGQGVQAENDTASEYVPSGQAAQLDELLPPPYPAVQPRTLAANMRWRGARHVNKVRRKDTHNWVHGRRRQCKQRPAAAAWPWP
jgi:hypothetical protein